MHVHVGNSPVGSLRRAEDPAACHEFCYNTGVPPVSAVSLLMPVVAEEDPGSRYLASAPGELHPVFDMNLPEGALRGALQQMFAKTLPTFDDFALLSIVGPANLGRLRFYGSGKAAAIQTAEPLNLQTVLRDRGTQSLFRELVERYARSSGVSGAQPKLLVRSAEATLPSPFSPPTAAASRITVADSTHILKSFDPEKYPEMAANESLGMLAAARAGLPVPHIELANDGGMLVIERFDVAADGSYCGFEDACALAGVVSKDKYTGSYEGVAKLLRSHLRGDASLLEYFKIVALSTVLRNGDAHRKNFGVLYPDVAGPVRLAPAYDILTTTAYVRDDSLALLLDGSKRWPTTKKLLRFGIQHCGMTKEQTVGALEQVRAAVAQTRADLERIGSPGIRGAIAKAWEDGLRETRVESTVPVAQVMRPAPVRPLSAADIDSLRERTGCGLRDACRALEWAQDDLLLAEGYLKYKDCAINVRSHKGNTGPAAFDAWLADKAAEYAANRRSEPKVAAEESDCAKRKR